MNTKLHTLLALSAALGTCTLCAQDNPPPPPPLERPDSPVYPPDAPRRDAEPRRPGAEQPRIEGREANRGDRPPGAETRRGPGENFRREGELRREGGPRPFPMPPQPAAEKLRPYLGVVTSQAPAAVAAQTGLPEGFGLVVDEVLPDSPAKAAGVERYDVLTKFDDQKLVDSAQLAALVGAAGKDAEVSLTLLRRGQETKVTLRIGEKMLPERQTVPLHTPLSDLRNLWRRYEGAAAPYVEEAGRRALEVGREFQRRMQEFQERVEQWRKNPSEKFPEMPKFPSLEAPRPSGPLPGDVLREARPGGAASVQRSGEGSTTTWSTANANVSIKDENGEIEVRSENGRRTVIARDRSGATVFDGPIDTEEQRRQLPEAVRDRLQRIEMHHRSEQRDAPRTVTPPRPPAGVQ